LFYLEVNALLIERLLRQHLGFEPTADQDNLIACAAEFLANPKHADILLINGYAGTGKTTIIAALVKTLSHLKRPFALIAPTGRAAKVMAQYAAAPAFTIHKQIYRQQSGKDGIGKFVLRPHTLTDAVFIVDEASMIANSSLDASIFGTGRLLDDLMKYSMQGTNCKIIIVGDNAQLPPVGLDVSPALDKQILSFYGKCIACSLQQVVRQEQESGILRNATMVRRAIEAGSGTAGAALEALSDIKRITGSDFIETLSDAYSKYSADEVAVIVRTNKQANRYNAGIRSMILGREEELVRGDRLMVVKNNYSWIEKDEELSGVIDFIANGDIVEVLKLGKYSQMYGFRFVDARIRLPDYDDAELDCRMLLDTLAMESAALGAEQSRDFYAKVMLDYAHIGDHSQRYAAVRRDAYFSALQIKHANAITCHKAQGGQWRCVFVDHGFLSGDICNLEFMRWLYTALTRGIEQVYLINFDKRLFA
jgi:exodeoxyribonuclease-5